MPRVKKQQKLYKQQSRTLDGKFGLKKKNEQLPSQNKLIHSEETNDNIYGEFNDDDANEWEDDDDSGWEDEIDFEKEKSIQLKLLRKELGKLNNYFTVIVFSY